MRDELLVDYISALHALEQHVQLSLVEVVGVAVAEAIEVLPVELRVSLRQHREVERRERQYLAGVDAVEHVVGTDEGVPPALLRLESPQLEVDDLSHDVLRGCHGILNHRAAMQHDLPLNLRLSIFLAVELEDTELEVGEEVGDQLLVVHIVAEELLVDALPSLLLALLALLAGPLREDLAVLVLPLLPVRVAVIQLALQVLAVKCLVAELLDVPGGLRLVPLLVVADLDHSREAEGEAGGIGLADYHLRSLDLKKQGLAQRADPAVGLVLQGRLPVALQVAGLELGAELHQVVLQLLPQQTQLLDGVARSNLGERDGVGDLWIERIDPVDDSEEEGGDLVGPVHAAAVACRRIAVVAAQDDQVQRVGEAVHVVALQLYPAAPSLFGNIERTGIFEHDSFLIAVDALAEAPHNFVVLADLLKFHQLQHSLPLPHDFGQYLLPLCQRVLHEVDFFIFLLQPQYVEKHEAELVLVGILIEGDHLVHAELHHFMRVPLDNHDLAVEDALLGDHQFVQHLHERLVQLAVVDGVAREQLDGRLALVRLQPLPVVLRLHVVAQLLVLFEETDLLLTSQHRPDREEDLDFVVEGDGGILELLAGLEQRIGEVVVVAGVFMERIEESVDLDADLEVLENDTDDPLDLLCVCCSEEPAEDRDLVVGRGHQLVEQFVELVDGKR